MPNKLEWASARENWCEKNIGVGISCTNVNDFITDLSLPFAGYRDYYYSNIQSQGSVGSYWSSSPDVLSTHVSYDFVFSSSNSSINLQSTYFRPSALAIRCFKDTSSKMLTFDIN